MATVVTVNGVEVGFLEGSMEINKGVESQHLARFTTQSVSGVARPVRNQDVIITTDGVRKFGGLVDTFDEASTGAEPQTGSNDYTINAIDYSVYADDRHVVNGGFVEGTLLVTTALPALLGYLSPNGVTLNASGISDYALPHSPYDVRSIRSISDEIAAQFNIAWEIDEFKVYRWFVPGTTAAPFNITDADGNDVGDMRVEFAFQNVYNYIIGRLGSGTREVTDVFTGNGGTAAYAINYFPLIAHRGYVIDDANASPQVIATLSIDAPGTATWNYDTTTGIVTRSSNLPNLQVANFIYTAQFPITITADGATSPIRELVIDLPNIFDRAAGQLIIDIQLAASMANPRLVHYQTKRHGLEPGMLQTINYSRRNLTNVVGYIQEVIARHQEGTEWIYDVTFLEGLDRANTWKAIYPEWSDMGGGGGSSVATGTAPTPSAGGAAPPVSSVQFNRAGTLGGDAGFIYYEATDSVVCGGNGSNITATNPQSCQVFGDNCHIVNP